MSNCPECGSEITTRNGRFGEFLCCPKGHGTFSIQGGVLYFSGVVGNMFKNQRIEETYKRLSLEHISSGVKQSVRVSYENCSDLSDKGHLQQTYAEVRKCLILLPPSLSREDWLRGMLRLTRGTVSPSIVMEVYDEPTS